MAKQELYEYEVRNNADIETPHQPNLICQDRHGYQGYHKADLFIYLFIRGRIWLELFYFSFFDTPICLMIFAHA